MEFFRKIKIAMLIVLLPAMLALTGNAIFNMHIHKRVDGTTYVHAHPMPDGGAQKGTTHSHTDKDFYSIRHITSFIYIAITALFLSLIFAKQLRLVHVESIHVKHGFTAVLLYNRPPPFLV